MHGGRRGKGGAELGLSGRYGLGGRYGLSRRGGLSRSGRARRGSGRRLDLLAANRAETSAVVNLGATTGTEHIGYRLGVKQQVVRTFGARTTIFTAQCANLLRNMKKFLRYRPRLSKPRSDAADYANLWPQFMQKA